MTLKTYTKEFYSRIDELNKQYHANKFSELDVDNEISQMNRNQLIEALSYAIVREPWN